VDLRAILKANKEFALLDELKVNLKRKNLKFYVVYLVITFNNVKDVKFANCTISAQTDEKNSTIYPTYQDEIDDKVSVNETGEVKSGKLVEGIIQAKIGHGERYDRTEPPNNKILR
jgi:hypothetical protein